MSSLAAVLRMNWRRARVEGGRWVTAVVQATGDGGQRWREVDDWEGILEVELYIGFVGLELEGWEKG